MSMEEKSTYKTRVTLLQKLKDSHDDAAWADFAYYYRNYIYNIARRMNLGHDDANEIVQLVILKSWNKLKEFNYDSEKGRFRGWLCRVAGNEIRNYFRDQKKRYVSIEEFKTEDGRDTLEQFTDPEIEKIAEQEWEEYVPKLAWKNISESFEQNARQTYELFLGGKTPEEIAEKLGISKNTVYVHKNRIREKLLPEIKRLKVELG
ncbi:MAG TPA: sigma-70 family RNA polymerase sigma factor [Lentisphaeria bacterium]|nr:sigma-70 family RNA polymerase sigma factor [Lentisphaeria bacterium]